jgi:formiminotetrahydrofolate cyclodeaminase
LAYGDWKVSDFTAQLASSAPVPGGGSVAALAGALGVSLFVMVGEITMGKKKPEDKSAIEAALKTLAPMRTRFLALIYEDAASFEKVMAAFKLPKETPAQEAARKEAVERATVGAAEVPLETARLAVEALAAGVPLAEQGAKAAVSDVACGALCLEAAIKAAAYNVRINLGGLEDEAASKRLASALAEIEGKMASLANVRVAAEGRL